MSPAPEPVLPCGPLAEPALADPCGLLADDGGVTGPVGVESHRSEEGEGVSTLENPLDGDGLEGLMEDFLDLQAGSECSQAHVSEAAWYARADARDESRELSRASPSFEVVSDMGARCELAGDRPPRRGSPLCHCLFG